MSFASIRLLSESCPRAELSHEKSSALTYLRFFFSVSQVRVLIRPSRLREFGLIVSSGRGSTLSNVLRILTMPSVAMSMAAQQPAPRGSALAGTVRDSVGATVPAATIEVDGSGRTTVSDDSGRFHLAGLKPGRSGFVVRRVGFESVSFETTLAPDSTLVVDIRLRRIQQLGGVTVTAERSERLARFGYFDRKRTGLGSFVTPERIDSMPGLMYASQFLRGLRGLDLVCGVRGCVVHTRRPPDCLNLFVNGVPVMGQLDETVSVGEVYAMEVYERPVLVPSEFQGRLPPKTIVGVTSKAGCGAIVVWTATHMGKGR